jgi:hypothetical protein
MATKKKPNNARARALIAPSARTLRLDLGSGPRPAEGFEGVDIAPGVTNHCVNLCDGSRWPWASNSVDELRSSHFIEHVDAGYVLRCPDGMHTGKDCGRIDALLWFFDEAFRIAKPNALFTVQWPALQNVRAFQDPTHRRFIPAEMITYLSREGREAMGVEQQYGATCNWIGTVAPTIRPDPETDEDRAMALRADSSDEKQAWARRKGEEQQRRYFREWGYSQDFIAHLRAVK